MENLAGAVWMAVLLRCGRCVCVDRRGKQSQKRRAGSRGGRCRAALYWMGAAKTLRDQAQFFRMPKAAATRAKGSSSGSAMTKSSVAAILARPQVT